MHPSIWLWLYVNQKYFVCLNVRACMRMLHTTHTHTDTFTTLSSTIHASFFLYFEEKKREKEILFWKICLRGVYLILNKPERKCWFWHTHTDTDIDTNTIAPRAHTNTKRENMGGKDKSTIHGGKKGVCHWIFPILSHQSTDMILSLMEVEEKEWKKKWNTTTWT